jgi:hypothetical protein
MSDDKPEAIFISAAPPRWYAIHSRSAKSLSSFARLYTHRSLTPAMPAADALT